MEEFPKLFQPGKIGNVEIRNRIALAAQAMFYVASDGSVSDRQIAYYSAMGRGGLGVVLTEAAYPRRKPYPKRLEVNDDSFIPGLARLAKAVHETGAKIFMQMNIGRGRGDTEECVSASSVAIPGWEKIPRTLTLEEIEVYMQEYGEGARRAREAGYDGMAVHGNGGYLIDEFLSPFTNRRTDAYGGSIEKRAKFAVDLVKSAKARAGSDFPIVFKLMSNEHAEAGLQLKDSVIICQLLEKAGVDAIEVVSGNWHWTAEWAIAPMGIPHCHNVVEAATIKRNVGIPIMVGGRVIEPREGEDILVNGQADFIVLGRALLADPEWPNKAMSGRAKEVRRCIGCLHCMDSIFVHRRAVTCTVNPWLGEEGDPRIIPASKPKKVLVIGGGPGGMEAAHIAAIRGHDVSLWEKTDSLGGQVKVAVKPPDKWEIGAVTEYLTTQVAKAGVKVELEKEATPKLVKEFGPDAVIVATGATHKIPEIPGVNGSNVVTATEVLAGVAKVGERAIVLGGGMVGCETADFLAQKGHEVTILKAGVKMAEDLNKDIATLLMRRLERANVRMVTQVEVKEISKKGVTVTRDGATMFFPGDTVVLAKGMKSENKLAKTLEGKVPELYNIGDSVEPRAIFEAIYEGAHTSAKL